MFCHSRELLEIFAVCSLIRSAHPRTELKLKIKRVLLIAFHVGVATKFMLVKPRGQSESVLKNTAKIANNLSVVTTHQQKTGHEPDLDNVKV